MYIYTFLTKAVAKSRKIKSERWISLNNNQKQKLIEDYVTDNDKEISLRRLYSRILTSEDKTSIFNFGVRDMSEYIKRYDKSKCHSDVIILNILPLFENEMNPIMLCYKLSKVLANRKDYFILGDDRPQGPTISLYAIGLTCKAFTKEVWLDLLECDIVGLPYCVPIVFDRQDMFDISTEAYFLFSTPLSKLQEYKDIPINLTVSSNNEDRLPLDAVLIWWKIEYQSKENQFQITSCPKQLCRHSDDSSSTHYVEKQTLIRLSEIDKTHTNKTVGRYEIEINEKEFELILRMDDEILSSTGEEEFTDMSVIARKLRYPLVKEIWSENLAELDKKYRYDLSMIKLRLTRRPDELKEVIKTMLMYKYRKSMIRDILEEWTR